MNKKEEYKELKKDVMFNLNLYTCGMVVFVIGSILVLLFTMYSDRERIENIECALGLKECVTAPAILSQPDPLEGWKEECIENKTIIHNDTIGIIQFCRDGCMDESACISAFGKYNCENKDECELQCQNLFNVSKYKIWNETICIKKILVKEE